MVAVLVFLLIGLTAFCWSIGSEVKQFEQKESVAAIIPVALGGIYFIEHPELEAEEKQEICDLNADDLVPCIEKMALTPEMKNACVIGQQAMQKYRDKILSSSELLIGLARVGTRLRELIGIPMPYYFFGIEGEPLALSGIDLIGLHPVFSEALVGLENCLKEVSGYRPKANDAKLVLPQMLKALNATKSIGEVKRLAYYANESITSTELAAATGLKQEIEFVCANDAYCGQGNHPISLKQAKVEARKRINANTVVCFTGTAYKVIVGYWLRRDSAYVHDIRKICGAPQSTPAS